MYPYRVRTWLDGDPGEPPPPPGIDTGRNAGWRHLDAFDVLAMPDPWEYPWFAAWDLAFHSVVWAHLDPAFAKYQLLVLLKEWFLHPNGALPAYEWSFDDVNPPVHALAAIRVFVHRRRDRPRLPRTRLPEAAPELHLVAQPRGPRRQQPLRRRVPRSGQPQPDRPIAPSPGDAAGAGRRHRVDGLLLIGDALARHHARRTRRRLRGHGRQVRRAVRHGLRRAPGLGCLRHRRWLLLRPDPRRNRQRTTDQGADTRRRDPRAPGRGLPIGIGARPAAPRPHRPTNWPSQGATRSPAWRINDSDGPRRLLVSVVTPRPTGPRPGQAVRRRRLPVTTRVARRSRSATRHPTNYRVFPAPSSTTNRRSHAPRCTAATRTGVAPSGSRSTTSSSARWSSTTNSSATNSRSSIRRARASSHTLREIAANLADRLIGIWLPGPDGRRPVYGGVEPFQTDPAWKDNLLFYEYFHGDNGAGLGAMHQTGWTALVADLIIDPPGTSRPIKP